MFQQRIRYWGPRTNGVNECRVARGLVGALQVSRLRQDLQPHEDARHKGALRIFEVRQRTTCECVIAASGSDHDVCVDVGARHRSPRRSARSACRAASSSSGAPLATICARMVRSRSPRLCSGRGVAAGSTRCCASRRRPSGLGCCAGSYSASTVGVIRTPRRSLTRPTTFHGSAEPICAEA